MNKKSSYKSTYVKYEAFMLLYKYISPGIDASCMKGHSVNNGQVHVCASGKCY